MNDPIEVIDSSADLSTDLLAGCWHCVGVGTSSAPDPGSHANCRITDLVMRSVHQGNRPHWESGRWWICRPVDNADKVIGHLMRLIQAELDSIENHPAYDDSETEPSTDLIRLRARRDVLLNIRCIVLKQEH